MTRQLPGTFVWNELASADPDGALRFYAEVFGWSFEPFELPGGRYWVARQGERLVGGIGGLETGPPGTTTSGWICWVAVVDVDAAVARAADLGGDVLEAPHDVPNVGRVAVVRDPTAAVLGLLQGDPDK